MATGPTIQIKGLEETLRRLERLPPAIASKKGGPAAVATRKAMAIMLKAARRNLTASINAPGNSGITRSTGFTAKKVVTKRGRPPSGVKGEVRVLTVRQDAHPSGNKYRGNPIRANDVAFILEAGTSSIKGYPWLRPAFNATVSEVIQKTGDYLNVEIDKVVRMLERS
jgi:hypothetical protein